MLLTYYQERQRNRKMKLPKAIEIAKDPTWLDLTLHDPDFTDALKILIEAGTRITHLRHIGAFNVMDLLPGETKE
ncbi:hypothetical protein ES708_30955 [subsurface metagenome]